MKISIIFHLFLLFCPLFLKAQMTIEDHLAMENINDPQLFGNQVIYTKTTKETWDGKTSSSIVLLNLDSKNTLELTQGEYDYDPKWSPGGEWISFVSYRNNQQQVYIIPAKGGAPKKISDAQAYISNYQWLDNQTIAIVDDEPRDSLLVATENANGGGYQVGTEFYTNAIWTYDIGSGKKNKVTKGEERIIDFTVSADSRYLAMLGAKNYDTYEAITNSWIKVLDLKKKEMVYQFREANALNQPTFSPTGKYLAFAGSTVGYSCNDGLFVVELKTGRTKNLSYDLDPTIEKIRWLDKKNLCFSAPKDAYTAIYQVNVSGHPKELIRPYWVIYDFQIQEDQLVFTASRSSQPKQLYQLNVENNVAEANPLSQLNVSLLSKIKTTSKGINYQQADGHFVQAILTFPINYDSTQKYPLMCIPHGGPDALVLDDFDWMKQFFADQGYLVFQPNFRGSIGYGRDFYAANRAAFGKGDFADIMAGIDYLIEKNLAHEGQLVIGGWSYGGYMANWAITQTDRFQAAISVAGMSNLVSLYGQHEFSNRKIGIWEYKGLLVDEVESYRQASPIFQVKKVQTPLLILHGDNDSRSPTLQAWEMYRAMKDAGKIVEMIIYPRAGHNISNPKQRKSVLNQWLEWSNKYLSK